MTNPKTYSSFKSFSIISMENQIRELFEKYSIFIESQNGQEFNIYCPFHKNRNSPAFFINIRTGLWQCFNPSCGKKGNFRQLYKQLTGKSYTKDISLDPTALKREIEKGFKKQEYIDEIDISSIEIDYNNQVHVDKLQYFINRGFDIDTLMYFEVGFSEVKNRIVIPVRDINYKLIGFIGRAILDNQEPKYLYNKGFKRADTLFNIQNAKQYSSCIITEGGVDAMKVYQAGFPNVVSTLGAQVSPNQVKILKRYFDSLIIFSDNDDAGKSMQDDIIDLCGGKEIFIVENASGCKDAGEMTKIQIIETLTNKKTIF